MSSDKIFDTTIEKNGYNYYVVPKGYPLFKASKEFNNPNNIFLNLESGRPYFFGLKNQDPDYIYNYEDEYGIIFEYITTEPLELLALDNEKTMDKLYREAPSEIKTILKKNYGFYTKSRLSDSQADRIFSNYLCTTSIFENPCSGYAIYEMDTDFGGKFHPELLICNASKYVKYVRQVTTNSRRIEEIIESQKLKQLTNNLEQARRQAKNNFKKKLLLNLDNESQIQIQNQTKRNLFNDDSDNEKINGGKKKQGYRNSRRTRIKSRRTRIKSRRTRIKSRRRTNK
jgi:hypothetical protein